MEQFLKNEKNSLNSRFVALEYFRRVFDYQKSFKVLKCEEEPKNLHQKTGEEVQLLIQHLRLRNLLGGSSFAIQLIRSLHDRQRQRFSHLIAPILTSNYQYKEALPTAI